MKNFGLYLKSILFPIIVGGVVGQTLWIIVLL